MPAEAHDTTANPTIGAEPVTRTEIIDHVAGAFEQPPATPHHLVAEARRTHARRAVVELLGALPDRPIHRPQDLWAELPDVPIGG